MNDGYSSIQTALVVDDQAAHRKLAVALLKKLGVTTLWQAADGREGLEQARLHRPDLIICDVDMPDMDGMALLRGLRDVLPKPEIVILSSVDAAMLSTVQRLARDYGLLVLGALPKPAHIQSLSNLLARTSRHSQPISKGLRSPVPAPSYSDALLLQALADNAYEPYMEPKIDRITGHVVGAEALARLCLPGQPIIAPIHFIERLEALGKIDELTWQIAEKALRWQARWQAERLSLTLAINLSPTLIESAGMADRFTDLARRHGLPTKNIVIEITESAAISTRPETLEILARLRLRGFGLSIDDFGTGYSSLSQLSSVPFSELKIDRVFTAAAEEDYKARAVVEASIELARKLGLKTCAEGVEFTPAFQLIHDLEVDTMQGYLFSRPLPAADFGDWVRLWNTHMSTRRLYLGERL